MTAQSREILSYNGKKTGINTEPLKQYLEKNAIRFLAASSACWRGYQGFWEIKEDKLYLTRLIANIEEYKEVGLDYLFPEQDEVFAQWFNGEIRIPKGKKKEIEDSEYILIYERELILKFANGELVDEKTIDNKEKSEN